MTQEIWKYKGGGSPEGSGSLLDQSGGEAALRKGPWAKEEDEILLRYVKEKGIVKWTSIGKHTGLARSGKSCRLRWLNHLRPNLKKGSFSKDEQNLIVWMHSKYGNKWTRIASKLPGRTDNEIKNFWNTRVKKCQKQKLPIYPESIEEDQSPISDINNDSPCPDPNNNFTISDNNQIPRTNLLSSLHQFSSISPHSPSPTNLSTQTQPSNPLLWPLQQPPLAPYLFSSQKQTSPTYQPIQSFLQQPQASPSHYSSLHQSRPTYQSMQGLLPGPAVPSPNWLSSPDKDHIGQQSSICHSSTHPLTNPSISASTRLHSPLILSSSVGQFTPLRRSGSRLPRPLSTPLLSSTLDHFLSATRASPHSTLELNLSNQAYSVSPLKLNSMTQTSTIPTVTINSSTAGSSNSSSLKVSPVDMTWPSISRSLYNPVSRRSSSSISELSSIQSSPTGALKHTSDMNISLQNAKSMTYFELLDASLQEALTKGVCKNSRKEDFLGQNLTRESLLSECLKTKDLLDNILMKENLSSEISKTRLSLDENSRKEGLLTQSFKTADSSGSSLNTENSSHKRRRKDFINTSTDREDLFGMLTNKGESLLDQKLRAGVLEKGTRREGFLIESLNEEGHILGDSSSKGCLWSKISKRDELADGSMSQGFHSLIENSRRELLLASKEQKPVLDESGLFLDQRTTCALLESGGLGGKLSCIKSSAEEKESREAEEEHINNMTDELSSLLEFFPTNVEIPEWYNSNQDNSNRLPPSDELDVDITSTSRVHT